MGNARFVSGGMGDIVDFHSRADLGIAARCVDHVCIEQPRPRQGVDTVDHGGGDRPDDGSLADG